jgi:predicted ATPase
MSIKINRIKETTAKLYDPEDVYVGTIKSVLQLNDVRIQIMGQKLSGYYIIWKDDKLEVTKDGRMEYWPKGFFDTFDYQLTALINL